MTTQDLSRFERAVGDHGCNQTTVHVGGLSPSLMDLFRLVLPKLGLKLSDGPRSGATVISPVEGLDGVPAGDGPVVGVFDGKLAGHHAAALRRRPPVLLLACRERDQLPSEWEVRMLAALLRGGPLLPPTLAEVRRLRLVKVKDISEAASQASELARKAGAGKAASGITADVMHELAANALLDAPAEADGKPKYAHRRGADVEIAPADACDIALQVGDGRIFLSATDHFGRLGIEPIAAAVAGLDERAHVNASGGGAGLGMRRIIEHGDLFAVRIRPGRACQAVCAVDLGSARRRNINPKSLFFWVERG